jgi:microcystin degradation protein MlrC
MTLSDRPAQVGVKVGGTLRVFSGSLATETNTFGPMPTGLSAFKERAYYTAGTHPDGMQMHSGPLWAAREVGPAKGWTLIEGLVAAAVPNGIVTRHAYETLRDRLLDDLREALPVDVVLLGLHGAMVADGYDDCEGDLLARMRSIAGPDAVIGATLDPHCHLSAAMVENADFLVCWKEYPHTDILERAHDLLALCTAKQQRLIRPRAAMVDAGMVALLHTTRDPARGFIDRVKALEGGDGVLSVSVVQGFPWGDTPDMGSKILVYTDAEHDPDGQRGKALAAQLAGELFDLRHLFTTPQLSIDQAIDQALACHGTAVLADGADNAGGGAPSDSTFILRRLLDRGVHGVCLGPLWDAGAVRIAFDAGTDATLPMRIGGKICPLSGDPVDAEWRVKTLKRDMVMTGLAGTPAKLGDCALVETAGIKVVLTSIRCQAFNTDLFTQLGCDPASHKVVVVKSSQHFYQSFSKIAEQVIYVRAPGVVAKDFATLDFRKVSRPRWPLDELTPRPNGSAR